MPSSADGSSVLSPHTYMEQTSMSVVRIKLFVILCPDIAYAVHIGMDPASSGAGHIPQAKQSRQRTGWCYPPEVEAWCH